MLTLLSADVASVSDIVVYSSGHRPVLVVECKGGGETVAQGAAQLRRNLLIHGLIPDAPYLLLAFPTNFFLWKRESAPGDPPDFSAPSIGVLREYLGALADQKGVLREESLQLALEAWLGDLASTVRQPKSSSEADRIVVESGLFDLMKGGEVRSNVVS
jgi:hypothetical protein